MKIKLWIEMIALIVGLVSTIFIANFLLFQSYGIREPILWVRYLEVTVGYSASYVLCLLLREKTYEIINN